MTGIFLLIVMLLWVVIAFAIAMLAARLLPKRWWGFLTAGLLFFALLPLPLIDETLAKPQFEALCQERAIAKVDEKSARGKTVYLAENKPIRNLISVYPVRIEAQPWRYVDRTTGETVVYSETLHAEGGWLVRTLGISETRAPLLFRSYCAPENHPIDLMKNLSIERVTRE